MNKLSVALPSLFFFLFGILACVKDEEVNISLLQGKWQVSYDDPNLVVEGYTQYTFASDSTCSIYSWDVLSNRDTTIYRIYVISQNNDLITIFDRDEEVYKEQYWIQKLTLNEMRWENASPKDGNPLYVKLIKVKE